MFVPPKQTNAGEKAPPSKKKPASKKISTKAKAIQVEAEDSDSLVIAGACDFPDTSGDKLENCDILVQNSELMIFCYYMNGKILAYKATLKDIDSGSIVDIPASDFLEIAETGNFILSSKSLKRTMTLQDAIQVSKKLIDLGLI